ncbi:MAG: hypothetical protein MHPSP_000245, partial [Paramarteilia canceri]
DWMMSESTKSVQEIEEKIKEAIDETNQNRQHTSEKLNALETKFKEFAENLTKNNQNRFNEHVAEKSEKLKHLINEIFVVSENVRKIELEIENINGKLKKAYDLINTEE